MKSIIYPLSSSFGLPFLIKKAKQNLFLPFYHVVSDSELPHIQSLYASKSVQEFENDLDYLLEYFEPIDIQSVVNHLKGDEVKQPSFHLTFDDGLRECFEVIAPILKRKGIPASFFINPNFVDNQALFYRYKVGLILSHLKKGGHLNIQDKIVRMLLNSQKLFKKTLRTSFLGLNHTHEATIDKCAEIYGINFNTFLKHQQPYMTSSQILKLQKMGFHIGAHSLNHPKYTNIALEQQINQTLKSVDFVKKHFPSTINSFAFPFSSDGVSHSFFKTINTELDITFGTSGIKTDSVAKHLHRFPMEANHLSAAQLVKGAYLYYIFKKPLGKHIYHRK